MVRLETVALFEVSTTMLGTGVVGAGEAVGLASWVASPEAESVLTSLANRTLVGLDLVDADESPVGAVVLTEGVLGVAVGSLAFMKEVKEDCLRGVVADFFVGIKWRLPRSLTAVYHARAASEESGMELCSTVHNLCTGVIARRIKKTLRSTMASGERRPAVVKRSRTSSGYLFWMT